MEIDEETEQSAIETGSVVNPQEKHETTCRQDVSGKRQMKKSDSGLCDEGSDSSCDESNGKRKKMNESEATKGDGDNVNTSQSVEPSKVLSPNGKGDGFSKVKLKFKNRNYRSHSQAGNAVDKESSDEGESNGKKKNGKITGTNQCSPDSGVPEASSSNGAVDDDDAMGGESSLPGWTIKNTEELNKSSDDQISLSSTSSSSCCSDSSTSAMEDSKFDAIDSDKEEPPSVLLKQKPKHKWFATQEIVNRQIGCSNRKQGSELFQQRMYGSLHSVQRLELMYKLDFHGGCVNSLNFNQTGTLLASGSDDLQICLWDWPLGKLLTSFDTGHKSNVFQAKFLPLSGDTHMVTSGRDGQVRLLELASNGQLRASKKLAQHRGPAHKIATQNETPHVFLSSGEDGKIMSLDVRQSKPTKVLTVKEGTKKISLYSIHSNPLNNHEFVVCGRDHYLRIYDQRNTSAPKSRFCPQHLNLKEPYPHVTCAVFNYNGTEVVASYNDEDIYLFDTKHSEGCDFVHRYQGHRNSATVKGVNFFGPKSEFIVSGSDCGNIFFWEKETEAIVQWMAGDENGVVNCLEPHPEIPVLATSGLDEDVKIWVPSCEQEPTLEGLKKTVITNLRNRHADPARSSDNFDGQMLWILWRHISRTERHERELARRMDGGGGGGGVGSGGGGGGGGVRGVGVGGGGAGQDPGNSSEDSLTYSDEEDGQGQTQRLRCSPS